MKTKLKGRFVIGFDGADHVVYEDGEVVYEDDRVLFVGLAYPEAVDRAVDCGDAIVSPGFVDLDALADIDHGIIDTFQAPELARGLQWSEDYFRDRRHDVFTREEEAFQRRYAFCQLLLNGVTTAMPIGAETHKSWAETYDQWMDAAEAAGQLGIRMYLGPAYRSGVNCVADDGTPTVLWDEPEGERGLEGAVRFAEEIEGAYDGRLRGCLLPCRIETMTLDLLRETKRQADAHEWRVRIHAAQGANEVRLLRGWYGKSPVEVLAEVGLLGPRVSSPHGRFVAPEELPLLAETDTTIVHAPLASFHHGSALRSFDAFRRAGVNVALGTDTFPPDMIRAMDLGSGMNKHVDGDQSAGRAADFYRAATLGGAKALGRDDLGRLAPSAMADITVIDLSSLRAGPIDDPIRTMLYNLGGWAVTRVIVGGRDVVVDGQLPGVDIGEMRRRALAWFEKMKAHYPERDYRRRGLYELFPPSLRMVRRGHGPRPDLLSREEGQDKGSIL